MIIGFSRSAAAAPSVVPPAVPWQMPLSIPVERPIKRMMPNLRVRDDAGWFWQGGTTTSCGGYTIPTTANLVAWIDACKFSSFVFAGGPTTIFSVTDQSSNGYVFIPGTVAPEYDPSAFNSRPTIRFDDTATLQSLNNTAVALGTGNTLTIFAAATLGSDLVNGFHDTGRLMSYTAAAASHDYDNDGSFTLNRDASTSHLTFTRIPPSTPNVDISYATTRRIIFTLKSDGTRTLYIDGVGTSVAGAVASFVSPGYLSMGGSKFDSSFFGANYSGNISEWGVYSSYADPTAVGLLDTYLKNKWGMGAPIILSVSSGGAPSGTLLTITGSNFTSVTSVTIDGIEASFTIVDDSTILATVP